MQKLLEQAFWRLVAICGSLFCASTTALVAVLWSMNSSIATLNARVGAVMSESQEFKAEVRDKIRELTWRLSHVDTPTKEKAQL